MDRSAVNVLSLCAGAGGLDLGVRLAVPSARTVCYVEIEAYACEVLASRMEEGRLDSAPIWTDLRTFDGAPWRGLVDLVVGGYPCQPFSLAGKRLGADDPRHLWPHVARIVRELNPGTCFFENVSGHVSKGLREVRCELEDMGYRVEAEIVRAEEVGAPHRRERVFILAYSERGQLRDQPRWSSRANGSGAPESRDDGAPVANAKGHGRRKSDRDESGETGGAIAPGQSERCREAVGDAERGAHSQRIVSGTTRSEVSGAASAGGAVGNADSSRLEGRSVRGIGGADEWTAWPPGPADADGWRKWTGPQPAIRRGSDGLANRVDRLRLCGNGVVRRQAAYALRCLMGRIA